MEAQALGIWQMLEMTTTGKEWVCNIKSISIQLDMNNLTSKDCGYSYSKIAEVDELCYINLKRGYLLPLGVNCTLYVSPLAASSGLNSSYRSNTEVGQKWTRIKQGKVTRKKNFPGWIGLSHFILEKKYL
jgi:hypothetical protein